MANLDGEVRAVKRGSESRLEGGVNRANLKFINLSTQYKSGLR
jgi:hypothetical protein